MADRDPLPRPTVIEEARERVENISRPTVHRTSVVQAWTTEIEQLWERLEYYMRAWETEPPPEPSESEEPEET